MRVDLVIINAKIYTQNGEETADAMAISGDKIIYVGSGKEEALASYITPDTEVYNAE